MSVKGASEGLWFPMPGTQGEAAGAVWLPGTQGLAGPRRLDEEGR